MAVTDVSPEWHRMKPFDMIWIGMACWDVIYANQTLHYPTILLCNIDLFCFFLLFIIFFGLTVPTFLTQHLEADLFGCLRWRCREPTRLWTLDGDQRCIRPGDLPRLLMLVLFFVFRDIILLLTIDYIVFAKFAVVAILPRMFWKNGLKKYLNSFETNR